MIKTGHLAIDSPDIRRAGRDVLSLALMDARNHSLYLLMYGEQTLLDAVSMLPERTPTLWKMGRLGWFQERWVGRNLQRHLGRRADPTAARLPSLAPHADRWWELAPPKLANGAESDGPDLASTQDYLLNSLESTLELLEKTPETDDALYFYRLALFHEDQQGERLIERAQMLGLPLGINQASPGPVREPLGVPATRWPLGHHPADGGFAFDNEQPAHEVQVPEFEIDAQPVTWAQFVEFVDDGGYDRAELWHPQGWQWVCHEPVDALMRATASNAPSGAIGQGVSGTRRAPRYVEQMGVASGAVMQTRFGVPRRMVGHQPVMHVTWWEADAWCRWAGRRLPAEVEWELAAHTAVRRGFRWGDVWEWMGTTFQPYPGFVADPFSAYSQAGFGTHKVLRGASFATRARMKHPKFRHFALPERDDLFVGFRSCAV